MSGADWQQQQELLDQQHLLTKDNYLEWFLNTAFVTFDGAISVNIDAKLEFNISLKDYYRKEHGLPLDSEIKGL